MVDLPISTDRTPILPGKVKSPEPSLTPISSPSPHPHCITKCGQLCADTPRRQAVLHLHSQHSWAATSHSPGILQEIPPTLPTLSCLLPPCSRGPSTLFCFKPSLTPTNLRLEAQDLGYHSRPDICAALFPTASPFPSDVKDLQLPEHPS